MKAWVGCVALLAAPALVSASTARYEVTFDAQWNATSHPHDFPSNPHFSSLIGGTHNNSVRFWEIGGTASAAIEAMAELGRAAPLRAEVQSAIDAGTAYSVIAGGGISNSPDKTSTQFEITEDYPLVTLVSMIAPSPDWFVGVDRLNLREGNQWAGKVIVDLLPYDAGTDHGVTFNAYEADTVPRGRIEHLTGFPFANTPPLGTFTFVRLVPGDYNRSGTLDVADLDQLAGAVRLGAKSAAYDLDGNGVVNQGDHRFWVHNLQGTHFGDSNLDGRFDSSDLTLAFQAGLYEGKNTSAATWAAGDWDGDGAFGSDDLILAFQDGGYNATALRALPVQDAFVAPGTGSSSPHAVPEPSAMTISLGAFVGLLGWVRRQRSLLGGGRDGNQLPLH